MNVKKNTILREKPQQLYNKIEKALEYYELPEDITVTLLQKWINQTPSPVNFISRVFNEANFQSELEAEKLLDLLTRLWNTTPRSQIIS